MKGILSSRNDSYPPHFKTIVLPKINLLLIYKKSMTVICKWVSYYHHKEKIIIIINRHSYKIYSKKEQTVRAERCGPFKFSWNETLTFLIFYTRPREEKPLTVNLFLKCRKNIPQTHYKIFVKKAFHSVCERKSFLQRKVRESGFVYQNVFSQQAQAGLT